MLQIALFIADTGDWSGHMGWGNAWWAIVMTVFMTATVASVAVVVTRSVSGQRRPAADPLDPARAVLAERYAAGDLTLDEYRERLEHL